MYSECALEKLDRSTGLGDVQLPPPPEFNIIPSEAGNTESEWTMFHTSIPKAAIRGSGCSVVANCHGGNP